MTKKKANKVLLTGDGRRFLVEDTGKDFHTQLGFVKKKDLQKAGSMAETNKGDRVAVLKPCFADLYSRLKRHAQIITPKDMGMIAASTGINKSSFVVDLGSGSGALACFLASIAKKVMTYDLDERSMAATKKNIDLLGLKNIKAVKKDCYQGIEETNADVITMDLPEPWRALESAGKALKTGGFLVNYSPHITQSQRLVNEAESAGFIHLKTIELIQREWVVEGKKARPDFRGLGHTGFLTFMRKFE